MTDWEIHGRGLGNCNCDYGCPCQFSSLPTHGSCEGALFWEVERGRWGDVRLDGVKAAGMFKWPGAVHEGNGTMQIIVDEAASEAQKDAMVAIITGQDTDEMATMWAVYSAMSPNRLETLRLPITIEIDIEGRTGTARAGDLLEVRAEPITHQVSGQPHRVQISLPHGFEYRTAEIGSGRTTARGQIDLSAVRDSYAQFNELHLNNHGVMAQ